jgi:hypothetical protein
MGTEQARLAGPDCLPWEGEAVPHGGQGRDRNPEGMRAEVPGVAVQ